MPKFIYRGDEGRVYPTLPGGASEPDVGETYTLPADPDDGRWEPVGAGAKKTAKPRKRAAKKPAEPSAVMPPASAQPNTATTEEN